MAGNGNVYMYTCTLLLYRYNICLHWFCLLSSSSQYKISQFLWCPSFRSLRRVLTISSFAWHWRNWGWSHPRTPPRCFPGFLPTGLHRNCSQRPSYLVLSTLVSYWRGVGDGGLGGGDATLLKWCIDNPFLLYYKHSVNAEVEMKLFLVMFLIPYYILLIYGSNFGIVLLLFWVAN